MKKGFERYDDVVCVVKEVSGGGIVLDFSGAEGYVAKARNCYTAHIGDKVLASVRDIDEERRLIKMSIDHIYEDLIA